MAKKNKTGQARLAQLTTVKARRTFVTPRGLYARIAIQLGIDPSYVSRVAHGHRKHERISKALKAELRKFLALAQKTIEKPKKK